MAEFLAWLGAGSSSTDFSILLYLDEPECPATLIK